MQKELTSVPIAFSKPHAGSLLILFGEENDPSFFKSFF